MTQRIQRNKPFQQCGLRSNSRKEPSLNYLFKLFFHWTLITLCYSLLSDAQDEIGDTNQLEGSSGHSFGWPIRVLNDARELTDCEGLGFQNATKNECGFCTGGNTRLYRNFSMNCKKNCDVNVQVDCAGTCGGNSYIDECSGICIGNSPTNVDSYRDCRGTCSSSGLQLFVDNCGVCHTGTSPFMDCTNMCHLPGQEKLMAKLLCGRCVGGMSGISESEVLDPCGNCKSAGIPCPCNGTGTPDVCGVCNGGGGNCMRVIRFEPRALPVNTNAKVTVEGAFGGRTSNIKCIFIEILNNMENNKTEISASGNGTHVTCSVRMKLGSYKVGVKVDVQDPPEEDYVEDTELLVYENAEYTYMSPTRAVFDRDGAQELIVTFSGGRVPPLPLICVISGEGWPLSKRFAPSESNTLNTCVIPYPDSSISLNIAQSFNGIHLFNKVFQLEFYASPPDMKQYYIAEDGHAVVIVFDRPVDLCNLNNCSQILNRETLSRLGEGAICQWATKQQLIITVQNAVKDSPFRVTFKRGILKQDGQEYALSKNDSLFVEAWNPQSVSSGQLAISGPSTVSYCGTFTLVGHFSSPKGDANFFWTAYREESTLKRVEKPIADALLEIRSATLTLSASLLEINMSYIFVLTAEHPGNEKYQAQHRVLCLPYIGPLVTAFSDVMTQGSVTVDQRITLQAEVSLPECSTSTEYLHLVWSVSNPEVKFNFKSKKSQVYVIEPYSLPENSEVFFAAHAYFGNLLNVTYSQIQLRVDPLKLRAGIKGAAKRMVGNKSGTLVLESEIVNKGVQVVYQWRCYDQDGPVCYNYKENSTEPLLLPKRKLGERSKSRKLEIPCVNLKGGKMLVFELQIFNANNRYQYSATASTIVVVEDRDIPQVVIDSVLEDGSNPVQRHPATGAYDIPAGLRVTVHASIIPGKSPAKSVKWDIKGFSSAFVVTTKNGKSILSLEEGFLVGHGIYLIGLSACDQKGNCGIANLTIHAVPGIALCKLEVNPYVEYEMIKVHVVGCSIPTGRQPVIYQLYIHSDSSVFPFTAPQTSTVFNIVGPPKQTHNSTQMSVQVCDKYLLCKLYAGPSIKVSPNENREEERKKLIEKAKLAVGNRNLFPALSMFLTAATDQDIKLSENEMSHMLDAASNVSKNRYIDAGQLSLIYSFVLPLLRQGDNSVKLKALDIIKRSTKLAFAYKAKIPTSVLSSGYSNGVGALQCREANSAVSEKVKRLIDFFIDKLSINAPLGSRILLSSPYPNYPSSLIFKQLPDRNPIYIKAMSKNELVEGSVRFEEAAQQVIQNRCKKNAKCEGIVVAMTLYPADAPYSTSIKRASPVLEITLRKPEDGGKFNLADVQNAIRLTISHSGNSSKAQEKGFTYRCAYYDVEQKDWSTDGIVTYGVDGSVMRCWSSHLTAFAVVENYNGLSAASIVGIVVTALMGVFIIMMFAFFFFRKKQAANARVSTEALQSKRPSDKLQGMNGSVVKVKTLTP